MTLAPQCPITIPMKATIHLDIVELSQIVRNHILTHTKVNKITEITFNADIDKDDCAIFEGVNIGVDLQDNLFPNLPNK